MYGQEDGGESTMVMCELPRTFVVNLRALDSDTLHDAAGDYLTDKEIECVLKRRELLLDWIDTHVRAFGKEQALY
jgi:hypothetical protein